MKRNRQNYEETAIGRLRPHPRNPRQGNLARLRESLDRNGWYGAIVAQQSTGYILAGNHRYRAALQRGAESLPVLWVDCDDETALRILLADNRTSDLAEYDQSSLAELLNELSLQTHQLEGTGYSDVDLSSLLADLEDMNLAAEPATDQTEELADRFQVLITCTDETEQTQLLERFQTEGLQCRALVS